MTFQMNTWVEILHTLKRWMSNNSLGGRNNFGRDGECRLLVDIVFHMKFVLHISKFVLVKSFSSAKVFPSYVIVVVTNKSFRAVAVPGFVQMISDKNGIVSSPLYPSYRRQME